MLTQKVADQFSAFGQMAANDTREDYANHWDEDYVTWNFIKNFEQHVNNTPIRDGYLATAQKVPDSGANSAEKEVGADLLLAVGLATQDGVVGSGAMIQAKWRRPWKNNSNVIQMVRELKEDSEDMVCYSPSSFGAVYNENNFRFYPAESLITIDPSRFGMRGDSLSRNVAYRETRSFLQPLLRGFGGDRWIFEHLEDILNTSNGNLPDRGLYTDGGTPSEVVEIDGTQAMVLLVIDEEVDYDVSEKLPFENEQLLSALGL